MDLLAVLVLAAAALSSSETGPSQALKTDDRQDRARTFRTRVHRSAATTISARDFGAMGDGRTDDSLALQKAIDHAQASRAILHVPAGVYLVNRTLHVRDNSGLPSTSWKNCSFSIGKVSDYVVGNSGVSCPAALRMVGDGVM